MAGLWLCCQCYTLPLLSQRERKFHKPRQRRHKHKVAPQISASVETNRIATTHKPQTYATLSEQQLLEKTKLCHQETETTKIKQQTTQTNSTKLTPTLITNYRSKICFFCYRKLLLWRKTKQTFGVAAASACYSPSSSSDTAKQRHNASIVTTDNCVLLRVRRVDFAQIFDGSNGGEAPATGSPFSSFASLNKLVTFELILSRPSSERTIEDTDIVYEELQHLKAVKHLSNAVRKQLAACVAGERFAQANTVVFKQGDIGDCWYVILRGSVNVVILGKGVVCTLREGDDFGKLALVNDAPRAASIVTNEPNCFFLRVNKRHFNSILRHVEENTVRLREHNKEVLVLQRQLDSPQTQHHNQQQQQQQHSQASQSQQQQQPYLVMAGTSDKILEHLLETRVNGAVPSGPLLLSKSAVLQHHKVAEMIRGQRVADDTLLEDFILTHRIFMPTRRLCAELLKHFNCSQALDGRYCTAPSVTSTPAPSSPRRASLDATTSMSQAQGGTRDDLTCRQLRHQQLKCGPNDDLLASRKRRVVKFVAIWMLVAREAFFDAPPVCDLITELRRRLAAESRACVPLAAELRVICAIAELLADADDSQSVPSGKLTTADLSASLKTTSTVPTTPTQTNCLAARCSKPGIQRWLADVHGSFLPLRRFVGAWPLGAGASPQFTDALLAGLQERRLELRLQSAIRPSDELVLRVHCADHSFATLKLRFTTRARDVKVLAASKLRLQTADQCRKTSTNTDDNNNNTNSQDSQFVASQLALLHVKSSGERVLLADENANFATSLSVGGRLFVCPLEHVDAVSPLPEQDPFCDTYQQSPDIGLSAGSSSSSVLPQQHPQQSQLPSRAATSQASASTSAIANHIHCQQLASEQQSANVSSHLLTSSAQLVSCQDVRTQMLLSAQKLDEFASRDIAFCLTQFAWCLLRNMHEIELLATVFGSDHSASNVQNSTDFHDDTTKASGQIDNRSASQRQRADLDELATANLNVLLRHFNELQYWVVTQVCLSSSLSKRVQILRKFIKIASYCKDAHNLNAFCAIVMGLSNMAVARLSQTWDKLPTKLSRLFSQFETLIDPSRNHRRYRLFAAQIDAPIIPFMPLSIKDMTFVHEGNKTYLQNGLVNFEKMQLVAQTLNSLRKCKSKQLKLDASSSCKFRGSLRNIELYFRDLKVIDNQRTLLHLSQQLEQHKN